MSRLLNSEEHRPTTRQEWGLLAQSLNISTIQISERDSQASNKPKRQREFVNTWSVDGFADELMQPAELSFGTFEKRRPRGAREFNRSEKPRSDTARRIDDNDGYDSARLRLF